MSTEYRIVEEPSDQESVVESSQKLVLAVRSQDDSLLGGLVGIQYWNGMFIDLVWVHERLRSRGIGTELMKRAEAALRARGGEVLFLSTWSFQAPAFYEKLGYLPFGILEGMPANTRRIWYSKGLGRGEV